MIFEFEQGIECFYGQECHYNGEKLVQVSTSSDWREMPVVCITTSWGMSFQGSKLKDNVFKYALEYFLKTHSDFGDEAKAVQEFLDAC